MFFFEKGRYIYVCLMGLWHKQLLDSRRKPRANGYKGITICWNYDANYTLRPLLNFDSCSCNSVPGTPFFFVPHDLHRLGSFNFQLRKLPQPAAMTLCPSTWNHSFARPTKIFNSCVAGRFSCFSS
jgi:hypothetical protein